MHVSVQVLGCIGFWADSVVAINLMLRSLGATKLLATP